MSERKLTTVKIEKDIARESEMIAKAKGVDLATYRSDAMRAIVRDDWIEWVFSLSGRATVKPHVPPTLPPAPGIEIPTDLNPAGEPKPRSGEPSARDIWICKMAIRARVEEADFVDFVLADWAKRNGVEPPPR